MSFLINWRYEHFNNLLNNARWSALSNALNKSSENILVKKYLYYAATSQVTFSNVTDIIDIYLCNVSLATAHKLEHISFLPYQHFWTNLRKVNATAVQSLLWMFWCVSFYVTVKGFSTSFLWRTIDTLRRKYEMSTSTQWVKSTIRITRATWIGWSNCRLVTLASFF